MLVLLIRGSYTRGIRGDIDERSSAKMERK